MDTQMVRNLGQPILLLPIGHVDKSRRLPFPLKQDAPWTNKSV